MDDLKKDSDFDTEFYVYGIFSGRLYFRGIRASHIFVDPVDGKWTIQSLKSPGKISKLSSENYSAQHYPVGRLEWTVQNNYTDSGKDNWVATLNYANFLGPFGQGGGTKFDGDRLSRGTKLVGDHLSRGT